MTEETLIRFIRRIVDTSPSYRQAELALKNLRRILAEQNADPTFLKLLDGMCEDAFTDFPEEGFGALWRTLSTTQDQTEASVRRAVQAAREARREAEYRQGRC
ncbi:MAG: hypothetical protein II697_03200 [Clostridia bacterium]|nr:hypothetical protein [Clostridia bacterium]